MVSFGASITGSGAGATGFLNWLDGATFGVVSISDARFAGVVAVGFVVGLVAAWVTGVSFGVEVVADAW